MLHALLEYRNAHYSGALDYRLSRQGVGLIITDDCEVLLADWQDGIVNGKYFYTDGNRYAYGSMLQGRYDGTNIFVEPPWTLFSECKNGKLDGKVTMVKESGSSYTFLFQAGYKLDEVMNPPINNYSETELQHQSILEYLVGRSELLRIDRQGIGKIFYGAVNAAGNGHGLGFVVKGGKLYSAGIYVDGKLNGPGRCYRANEIHDGTFKEGELMGVGCKWNSTTFYYMFAEFRSNKYALLNKGSGRFPTGPARRIREEFHLRSTNFRNDWILMRKLINVEVRAVVRTYTHTNLVIYTQGSALDHYYTENDELYKILEAALIIESPPKLRSPSEKYRKAYETTVGRSTPGSNHFSEQEKRILRNSTNQYQQLRNDSLCLYGKVQAKCNDSLLDAIRYYEQLKPPKRRSKTPKKRRC